ncbi:sulfite exporter TauE/SafE family protein [Rothia endophytica]|uniref:sulfite exporter TauE/SafE family protein n=1 Tax=Rothia endophytica TaxID=1324766 RepID=UPI001F43CD23|nr:sulfite exporter TauE/SafE family protein [Rothia endophytica]
MLLAMLLGAVIGLLMGALGGGGAILAVPALVFIFGFEPQDATLGSLVVMVAGTVSGIVNHAKMGSVDLSKGVLFGVLGIAGTYVGRYLAGGVDGNALMLTFAALLVVVASLMIKNAATGSQAVSGDRGSGGLMGVIKIILAALLVGVLVGFFGVGGGFMIVPTLTLLMGLSMRHAVGTSLVVIFINSVAGLGAGFAQLNQLDWGVLSAMAGAAVLAALIGTRIGARVPQKMLKLAFATLLYLVAIYTAINSFLAII